MLDGRDWPSGLKWKIRGAELQTQEFVGPLFGGLGAAAVVTDPPRSIIQSCGHVTGHNVALGNNEIKKSIQMIG